MFSRFQQFFGLSTAEEAQKPPVLLPKSLLDCLNEQPVAFMAALQTEPNCSALISEGINDKGLSLLHLVIRLMKRRKESAELYMRIGSQLMDMGANINQTDTRGYTAFMWAVRYQLADFVEKAAATGKVEYSLRANPNRAKVETYGDKAIGSTALEQLNDIKNTDDESYCRIKHVLTEGGVPKRELSPFKSKPV